ncbi:MAG: RsmE family RNA methyltransferase [Parachlamydiales bacterium]|jgi:16S rRNA (uracil1498-N3)-methyltransferase
MPKDRYYTNQDLKKNSRISVDGSEAVHIRTIMRKNIDDLIEVINGSGNLAIARITDIKKDAVKASIENVFFEERKKQKIVLIQALLRSQKLELILEKCTELGCSEFWFFNSKNSDEINLSQNKLDRMNLILISAIKQCGSLYLPTIKVFDSLNEIENTDGIFYYGDVDANAKRLINQYEKTDKDIFIIIGPEKGFSKEDVNYIKQNLKAIAVKLNGNILRAETAAIASVNLISNLINS